MRPFWFIHIKIAGYHIDIGLIMDVIIILLIICITIIYTIWRKNKKTERINDEHTKYTRNNTQINSQEGCLVTNVKENIKKYQNIKGFISGFFSLHVILFIGPILIGFLLYNIVTDRPNNEMFNYVVLIFGLLLYIYILLSTKKTLDKIENNLLYKIIKIFIFLIIIFFFCCLGIYCSQSIRYKLKLSYWLASSIDGFFLFLGFILGCIFAVWLLSSFSSSKNDKKEKIPK